jgi:hypothetical protein
MILLNQLFLCTGMASAPSALRPQDTARVA